MNTVLYQKRDKIESMNTMVLSCEISRLEKVFRGLNYSTSFPEPCADPGLSSTLRTRRGTFGENLNIRFKRGLYRRAPAISTLFQNFSRGPAVWRFGTAPAYRPGLSYRQKTFSTFTFKTPSLTWR